MNFSIFESQPEDGDTFDSIPIGGVFKIEGHWPLYMKTRPDGETIIVGGDEEGLNGMPEKLGTKRTFEPDARIEWFRTGVGIMVV